MNYLQSEEILQIHSMIVDETGGSHGLRDRGALQAIVELPKQSFGGKPLYEGIFSKAAVYSRGVIMNHPFIDGNKRTGMTAATIFLRDNGYKFAAQKGEIEKMALKIIKDGLEIEEIAKWLKNHTRKV